MTRSLETCWVFWGIKTTPISQYYKKDLHHQYTTRNVDLVHVKHHKNLENQHNEEVEKLLNWNLCQPYEMTLILNIRRLSSSQSWLRFQRDNTMDIWPSSMTSNYIACAKILLIQHCWLWSTISGRVEYYEYRENVFYHLTLISYFFPASKKRTKLVVVQQPWLDCQRRACETSQPWHLRSVGSPSW